MSVHSIAFARTNQQKGPQISTASITCYWKQPHIIEHAKQQLLLQRAKYRVQRPDSLEASFTKQTDIKINYRKGKRTDRPPTP
jgi:hypothetical protein